jgi:hypothetical protein
MPTLAWMSTRTGHKPVGYSHNVGFRCHREPEFLIEMNVCSSVGLDCDDFGRVSCSWINNPGKELNFQFR